METRNLSVTKDQAIKLLETNPELSEIIYNSFPELKKMKTWEKLETISGYYINGDSSIKEVINNETFEFNRNVFATEKQAKSCLAMAQLSQLMKDLGEECNVDWSDMDQPKYTISKYKNSIQATTSRIYYHFLAFNTKEMRDQFLEKHIQLIKDYFEDENN